MAEKLCPHCNHAVPPEFAVMPVCMMCGGDLNAQPTQVWSAIDLQSGTSFNCPSCQTLITSVLTTECPACGMALQPGAAAAPPAAAAQDIPLDLVLEEAPAQEAPVISHIEPLELPSFVSAPDLVPPEPVRRPEPVAPTPSARQPVKEGFFARLLRMLGLKK
jgi:hypothetical protein